MFKFKHIFFLLLFLFLNSQDAIASHERIVSLKPNITEILFELGVGDKVVGVTSFCDYPKKAKKLPKVGDYTRPFVEPLISLQPDLVITSKEESSRKSIEGLQRLGIKVAMFPFTTLDETISSILQIAKLVDRPQMGEVLASKMKLQMEGLKKTYAHRKKKKVLIVLGRKPLIVGSPNTYMGNILPLIVAQNVVSKGAVAYPRWGLENVIAADPEIIIDMSMESENLSKEKREMALEFWNNLRTVRAVREKKIYFMHIRNFRPSPRIFEGVEKLSAMIHPCNCRK